MSNISSIIVLLRCTLYHKYIRELKQSSCRMATAENKQLNFRVKKKPQTTDYAYVLHIWNILWLNVCEMTVLTVLKSLLSNTFHRGRGCRRPEDVKIRISPFSARRPPSRRWYTLLKNDFKTVNTVISHPFNHKICFKYTVYIVGCV